MNTQIQKSALQNFYLKSYDDVTKSGANMDKTSVIEQDTILLVWTDQVSFCLLCCSSVQRFLWIAWYHKRKEWSCAHSPIPTSLQLPAESLKGSYNYISWNVNITLHVPGPDYSKDPESYWELYLSLCDYKGSFSLYLLYESKWWVMWTLLFSPHIKLLPF